LGHAAAINEQLAPLRKRIENFEAVPKSLIILTVRTFFNQAQSIIESFGRISLAPNLRTGHR